VRWNEGRGEKGGEGGRRNGGIYPIPYTRMCRGCTGKPKNVGWISFFSTPIGALDTSRLLKIVNFFIYTLFELVY
jgi:hypothetical protein